MRFIITLYVGAGLHSLPFQLFHAFMSVNGLEAADIGNTHSYVYCSIIIFLAQKELFSLLLLLVMKANVHDNASIVVIVMIRRPQTINVGRRGFGHTAQPADRSGCQRVPVILAMVARAFKNVAFKADVASEQQQNNNGKK